MAEQKECTEITHVIFDMDGLLLDTETIYTKVTQSIVSPYGKEFTWAVKSRMMGCKPIEAATILVEALELPITAEEYSRLEKERALEMWPLSEALPGAVNLIHHLHTHKIPQAVATGSTRDLFLLKTQNHSNTFGRFHTIVTGDEVPKGKPNPDIFIEAAKRLGTVPGKHVLVFEDAVNGVQAAKAAGMSVIAVPHPSNDRNQFLEADLLLESLEHFDPTLFKLPTFLINE